MQSKLYISYLVIFWNTSYPKKFVKFVGSETFTKKKGQYLTQS